MRYNKKLLFVATALVVTGAGVGIYQLSTETPDTVYIHGSWNVPHDETYADKVESDVEMALYCSDDVAELVNTKPSDIAISMRADSALTCRYKSDRIPLISVVGFDNTNGRFVGDDPIPGVLVINVHNVGHSIDYYVPKPSLSEAMPTFANYITSINDARREEGLTEFGIESIRRVLDNSSEGVYEINGQYAGQQIDIDKAIELAIGTETPEAATSTAFLVPVYYILGE